MRHKQRITHHKTRKRWCCWFSLSLSLSFGWCAIFFWIIPVSQSRIRSDDLAITYRMQKYQTNEWVAFLCLHRSDSIHSRYRIDLPTSVFHWWSVCVASFQCTMCESSLNWTQLNWTLLTFLKSNQLIFFIKVN